jgi:hypothetical protein
MAGKKWNTGETAAALLAQARDAVAQDWTLPQALADLRALDGTNGAATAGTLSRLGSFLWNRRAYRDDFDDVRTVLDSMRRDAPDRVIVQAIVDSTEALLTAIEGGEAGLAEPADEARIVAAAREVRRAPKENRSVVDAVLVRAVLETVLAGDRSRFRALLGVLSRETVTLAAKGVGGSLPGVTRSLGYLQLRALQDILAGVLTASRVRSDHRSRALSNA